MKTRFFGGVYPERVEGPQNDITTQSRGGEKTFVPFVLFVVKPLLPFGCGFAALGFPYKCLRKKFLTLLW